MALPTTHVQAQAWADAQWRRSRIGKTSGRLKCEGIATVHRGELVELRGVGERFGGSVDILADITTGESGALLLYESGACCRVYPHHWGRVLYLGDRYGGKSWNQPQPV